MSPEDDTHLFRLVFRSRSSAAAGAADVDVDGILGSSRRRNPDAGVTSALMYVRPFFLQALEGSAPAVEATFDRICCDLRHSEIEIVECGPVLERNFGRNAMSFVAPDPNRALDRGSEDGDFADAAAAAMKLLASLMRQEASTGGEDTASRRTPALR